MTRKPYNSDFWQCLRATANGCLEWHYSQNSRGYGQIRFNGKLIATHRYAYQVTYGAIPEGMNVLHSCDNPRCCNPKHLFLGTIADNNADKASKGRARYGTPFGARGREYSFTPDDVRTIRRRYAAGEANQYQLADEYKTTQRTIWGIVNRKSWAWVMDTQDETTWSS